MDPILRLSFSLSLIGILFLLLLAQREPPQENIGNINNSSFSDLNKQVKIEGMVIKERKYDNNFKLIELKDATASIQITCSCKNRNIIGKILQVIGKVSEFNNEMQINADKIIVKE